MNSFNSRALLPKLTHSSSQGNTLRFVRCKLFLYVFSLFIRAYTLYKLVFSRAACRGHCTPKRPVVRIRAYNTPYAYQISRKLGVHNSPTHRPQRSSNRFKPGCDLCPLRCMKVAQLHNHAICSDRLPALASSTTTYRVF